MCPTEKRETLGPRNEVGTFHCCSNFDLAKERKKKLARRRG